MPEFTPTIEADNHASLSEAFGIKSSEKTEFKSFNPVFNGSGNYLCSAEYDKGHTYSMDADYCGGGSPDIVTALGVLLSAFGDVANSIYWPKIDVTFAAGIQASVKLDGHQHTENPHLEATLRTADVSGVIPAESGLGVPSLITVTGDVSPVNATVSFEMEHVDKPGAAGTHFLAQNIRCHVTCSIDYENIASSPTAGNWLNIIIASSSPNDDTPTSTLTAEQWIDVA